MLGDFDEEFAERVARAGGRHARRWYWRQAITMWWWAATRHPQVSHHYPRGGAVFDTIGDLRHAMRVAAASPGQSLLIVITLAMAIGTTTIGFAFADTVFLRGLPIADPDDTVIVYGTDARDPDRRSGVFFSDYIDFRDRARSVENLSTWTQTRLTLRRAGHDAARITVSRVTGDLFGVWGFHPQRGRGLRPGDDRPGMPPVAVLSDRFWTDAFARSDAAVGQSVTIEGVVHEIVGVLTPDVEFGTFANIAMWVSYPVEHSPFRDARPVMVTGRLADGVTAGEAAAEFRALAATLEQEHPDTNRGRQALVLQASRAMGGPNLWLVMTLLIGTAALVTVIASVNVAGVLLSRAVVRQREFALRVALGARKLRVFRQLAVEGLLLAGLGAVGGLFVAEAGLRLIRSVDAEPIFQQLVIDGHEVAFVMLLGLIAPLLFSFAPALSALRLNLVAVLNAASTRTVGSGRGLRDALVAAQLALAVALAIVGGLVARTATAQLTATNGFEAPGLVTFTLALDPSTPADVRRQLVRTINAQLLGRGVVAVGTVDTLPAVAIETSIGINPDGETTNSTGAEAWAHRIAIDHDALNVLHVPVVAGRAFTAAEVANNVRVVLISRETVLRYFGSDGEALGRRISLREGDSLVSYQIVGITGDVRNTDPERGMPPRVWMPMSNPGTVTFVVRSSGDDSAATTAIRHVARETVPDVPVEAVETYSRAIARTQGGDRVAMGMLISFASASVLFAAIGLYGTVALSANLRRSEFATRVALGAQTRDVTRLVMWQAFRLLLVGLVPGLALGLLAASGMRSLLFGVTPLDGANVVSVVTLLTLITLAASVLPAVRAARVDVGTVLRS